MKTLNKIFISALALGTLASCNLNDYPKFDDKDAFAAVDVESVNRLESGGVVKIPVTIASVSPVKATVTYAIVEDATSAVSGVNYKLLDETGTLVFDGSERTKTIDIELLHVEGFKGDTELTIQLTGGVGVKLGAEKTVSIGILDAEHPLQDILGTYSFTATLYDKTPVSQDVTFLKDPKDVEVVWISSLLPLDAGGKAFKVYGKVSEDHKKITVPFGQTGTWSSYSWNVMGFANDDTVEQGALELTATANGFTTNSGLAFSLKKEGEDKAELYVDTIILGPDAENGVSGPTFTKKK